MGLGYGVGNLGKIISPLGLALIVGSYTIIAPYMAEVWPAGLRASGGTNFIKPEASVEAMIPAMLFLAFWAALAAVAFVVLGIETKGRSIEEIDAPLTVKPAFVKAPAA
jgi:MFS transporter, putative metabolite:H+ symporter